MKTLASAAIVSLLLLTACGDKPTSEAPAVPAKTQNQETVFDSKLDALEQAKALEQQMKDAEERHKKAMQENGM